MYVLGLLVRGELKGELWDKRKCSWEILQSNSVITWEWDPHHVGEMAEIAICHVPIIYFENIWPLNKVLFHLGQKKKKKKQ